MKSLNSFMLSIFLISNLSTCLSFAQEQLDNTSLIPCIGLDHQQIGNGTKCVSSKGQIFQLLHKSPYSLELWLAPDNTIWTTRAAMYVDQLDAEDICKSIGGKVPTLNDFKTAIDSGIQEVLNLDLGYSHGNYWTSTFSGKQPGGSAYYTLWSYGLDYKKEYSHYFGTRMQLGFNDVVCIGKDTEFYNKAINYSRSSVQPSKLKQFPKIIKRWFQ